MIFKLLAENTNSSFSYVIQLSNLSQYHLFLYYKLFSECQKRIGRSLICKEIIHSYFIYSLVSASGYSFKL